MNACASGLRSSAMGTVLPTVAWGSRGLWTDGSIVGAFVRSGLQKGRRMGFTEELASCKPPWVWKAAVSASWATHITFLCKMGIIIPDDQSHFLGFQVFWCREISLGRRAKVPGLESFKKLLLGY